MWRKVKNILGFLGIFVVVPITAQNVNIIPIQNAKSLFVGGVIPEQNEVKIALTKNSSDQIILSVSSEQTAITSQISFPHKFMVLNTVADKNLKLTLGEVYPKVNIKEVSFISLLSQDGSINNYKLFTVENGFSEIFDAAIVDNNTLAIVGMGEIKVITTYGMVPASAMLPQGLLIYASPNLSLKKAFYISFYQDNRYIWRLNRVKTLPSNKGLIVAGEIFTEWDNNRNSPLNPSPFVAQISSNGSIKWAITIPTLGSINDLLIGNTGTAWLLYTDLKLSGTYVVEINLDDGSILKSFFIPSFITNNALFVEDKIVCAGKTRKNKSIEAGLLVIEPGDKQTYYEVSVGELIESLPAELVTSPMDIKVFYSEKGLGAVASALGGKGDKSLILITEISFDNLKSKGTSQNMSTIKVQAKKEQQITLKETKIIEIKDLRGNLNNTKLSIK